MRIESSRNVPLWARHRRCLRSLVTPAEELSDMSKNNGLITLDIRPLFRIHSLTLKISCFKVMDNLSGLT